LTQRLWPRQSGSSKDDNSVNDILKVHFGARLRLEFVEKVLIEEGDKKSVFSGRL
jgi:hypothetical protein